MAEVRTDPPKLLRVAAVQMKFADSLSTNLHKIQQAVRGAARRKADVVLFPECATTGYAYDFGALRPPALKNLLQEVSRIAADAQINVLVGTAVFAGRRLQNCLLAFDRAGRVIHRYAKCQLTDSDRRFFHPGNAISLFEIDGVCATSIICHERRYPELVRLPVMAGARILFHPNAGMDSLQVSRKKRAGRDGIALRAFENAIFYVFANSVGPQTGGKWSAGDSKIVAPDGRVLALANNQDEDVIMATLDLSEATRKYALESLEHPRFLARYWPQILRTIRRQATRSVGSDLKC